MKLSYLFGASLVVILINLAIGAAVIAGGIWLVVTVLRALGVGI